MLVRHARVESATFLSSFRGGGGGGVFSADPSGWLLQGENKIRKKIGKKYRPDIIYTIYLHIARRARTLS